MAFFALVLTFVLEQLRPLPRWLAPDALLAPMIDAAQRHLNAGEARHGRYAWLLLVLGVGLLVGLLHAAALWLSWLVALAFNVLVLYGALGFRQFSHPYSEIRDALAEGDVDRARRELTAWMRQDEPAFDASTLEADDLVRLALERGLLQAQRHVFGVLFWYVLLPGPTGPVMYRMADAVARRWARTLPADGLPPDRFGDFAQAAFAWCDWLPARLTSLGLAIVGDFEGTLYCWRRAASAAPPVAAGLPRPDSRTLLLASASGALGARIVTEAESARLFNEPGQEGAGLAEPGPRTLVSGAAMLWRAVLLWLAVLLLLTIVHWAS